MESLLLLVFASPVRAAGDSHEPRLSDCKLTPPFGTARTVYIMQVRYSDHDADAPAKMEVYVNNVAYPMRPVGGHSANGTYQVRLTLPPGVHSYYFRAEDRDGCSARFPSFGVKPGPYVGDSVAYKTLPVLASSGSNLSGPDGSTAPIRVDTVRVERISEGTQVVLECNETPSVRVSTTAVPPTLTVTVFDAALRQKPGFRRTRIGPVTGIEMVGLDAQVAIRIHLSYAVEHCVTSERGRVVVSLSDRPSVSWPVSDSDPLDGASATVLIKDGSVCDAFVMYASQFDLNMVLPADDHSTATVRMSDLPLGAALRAWARAGGWCVIQDEFGIITAKPGVTDLPLAPIRYSINDGSLPWFVDLSDHPNSWSPSDSSLFARTFTLNSKDELFTDILRMISSGCHLDVLVPSDTLARVSARLTGMPVVPGLSAIARAAGYEMHIDGNRVISFERWEQPAVGPADIAGQPVEPRTAIGTDSLVLGLRQRAPNPDAVAVVIGTETYQHAPAVQFALEDARAVKQYLTTAFGYQEGNIIYLLDPTKGQLEEVFGSAGNPSGKLYSWVKPQRSDVFVYYAGHGAPSVSDNRGYLVPVDANPDYVSASGYSLDLLYANLARIPAKSMTILIDACFSGAATDTSGRMNMLLKDASPLTVLPVPSENTPTDAVVMTSATGKQISSWYPEKGHSLFTYWFLNGLKGAADADKDGSIKLSELKAYLSENVTYTARRLYGRDQTPEVRGKADAEILKLK
ncbi:MAG: caspase family protein [candidate division WOR-3 bacterium]|nr:caspase family protein [candidate division WOR-3 bacterium]